MSSKRVSSIQRDLRAIGWRIEVDGRAGPQTHRAIRAFQNGYALAYLELDGVADRRTRKAIAWSAEHHGRASQHFAFREFASKGNGWIELERGLVTALERLRSARGGRPLPIFSGYRDPFHNHRVGGARFSQHLYGAAADLLESLKVRRDAATRAGFSGIGYDGSSGWVQHVDVRHLGPNNTTGAAPGRPTIWRYS